jgi:hypothetical protein
LDVIASVKRCARGCFKKTKKIEQEEPEEVKHKIRIKFSAFIRFFTFETSGCEIAGVGSLERENV